jgi:FlaA1/EpsC-like NDP-sugar epimerase
MFSTSRYVTVTRVVRQPVLRDVSQRLSPIARYFTTSKPCAISQIPARHRMQARQRTQQIKSHIQRSRYNMSSNNKDLELGNVFDVRDKVALVTGGGSGIGLMITQTLAVNGAKVYIVGRTEEKLEKVAEVHGKGIAGQIIPIVGNVATKDGVQLVNIDIPSIHKLLM